MLTPVPSSTRSRGFTLVEMLVSVAILTLIMVMVGQIVSSASKAISNARKLLNCDDQARLIFGRMDNDFSRMLKRSDVDVIFSKQSGSSTVGANDAIYFVTQSSGANANSYYTSSSTNLLTLAGYCIAPDCQLTPINPHVSTTVNDFLRLGHALTWDTGGASTDNLVFVSFAAPTSSSSTSALITSTTLDGHWGSSTLSTSSTGTVTTYSPLTTGANYGDYHVLGDQVFRFEYCFLLKDGTYSDVPIMTSVAGSTTQSRAPTPNDDISTNPGGGYIGAGSRWFDSNHGRAFICVSPTVGNAVWAPLGVQDVSAIIVAIALLDRDSRQTVISAAAYNTTLPGLLLDSTASTAQTTNTPLAASPKLMQQVWQNTIDSSGLAAAAGMSAATVNHIRIYQRYFYLNANNL